MRSAMKLLKVTYCKIIQLVIDYVKYYKVLKILFSNKKEFQTITDSPKIVINTINICQISTFFFECLLAEKLRSMGAIVLHLVDDGVLKFIDLEHPSSIKNKRRLSIREVLSLQIIKRFNRHLTYSRFISQQELNKIALLAQEKSMSSEIVVHGVYLNDSIDSSLIRAYRSSAISVKDEIGYEKTRLISIENAILSLTIAKNVDERINPDIVITSHGVYSSYGPFYQYYKLKNKKVITWGLSNYYFGRVVFSKKGLTANRHDDGFFESYGNKIDIQVAKQFTVDTLNKRYNNQFAYQQYYNEGDEVVDSTIKNFLVDNTNVELYGLFPNVFWDNSLTGTNTVFNSSEDWLLETIDYFQKIKNKKLVIRAHPAEFHNDTKLNSKKIIETAFGKNVNNISNLLFIDSDLNFSSYLLFQYLTAGIVYNGSIGLEMLAKNIPVIIAGNAPYSKNGFTFDIKNKQDYFDSFNKIQQISAAQKIDSIYKFFYYYLHLNHIPLNVLSKNDHAHLIVRRDDMLFINDRNLTNIAEVILGEDEFFQEWFFNKKVNN